MKNQNDLDHDLQHIFDKYAKNLCLYALNYLETEADAEDIVQDVFIRCWEKKRYSVIRRKGDKNLPFQFCQKRLLRQDQEKRCHALPHRHHKARNY